MNTFIKENKPDIEVIRNIGMQISKALQYLHGKKIIHQDIKPENILMTKDRQGVKLADFGVSNRFEATIIDPKIARNGTLRYMSPEQLDGRLSFKSDIWSLGCLLLQLSTGKKPFFSIKDELQAALFPCSQKITPL